MKTTILNTILAVALSLSVSNVYADGTRGAKKDKSTKSESVLNKLESFTESEIVLEAWMTEVKEFVSGEVFYEEEVNLENWMMEEFSANMEEVNFETEIEIENWMINSEDFNENFTEEEVALEDWMCKII